jgi:hypothetical protein
MKTKIINIYLIAIFTFISLNISANTEDHKGHKPASGLFSAACELENAELHFEAWMTELSAFNNNIFEFTDKELQIEDWMTVEFSGTSEDQSFLDQDICIEDWMKNTSEFRNEDIAFDIEPEIEPWMSTIM